MIAVRNNIGILIAMCAGLGLSACGSISLVKPTPAADIYDLTPVAKEATSEAETSSDAFAASEDGPPEEWLMIVEEPMAERAIDTDRIMLKPSQLEIQYIGGARWSDRAPSMIQDHMIESFETSGQFAYIGRENSGLLPNYELKSELQDFQVETFGGGGPRVVAKLSFKVVRYPSSRIVSTQVFGVEVPIVSKRITKIVDGFDQAVDQIVNEAIAWSVEETEADYNSRNRVIPLISENE